MELPEENTRGRGKPRTSSPLPPSRRQRRAKRPALTSTGFQQDRADSSSSSSSGSESQPSAAAPDGTTLITGGTTIWSCGSVTVHMSSSNAGVESPSADPVFGGTPQIQPPASSSSSETYETGWEVYRRHISLKKKGRYPLWIPQPNLQLLLDYRRRGTQVGDVGIITDDGAFDFMFNICSPAANSFNPPNLPAGFRPINPLVLVDEEIAVLPEHSARDALTSRGIAKQVLPSGELVFTCTQPNGAILMLPNGAVTERLLNYRRFQQYYTQNAESWYTFALETRGPDVRNGGLHLVYGCDKATEWGMISFDNPHRGTKPAEIRFRKMGEDWRDSVGTPYAWEHTDDAEGRVGPRDWETRELGGSRDDPLRNQTLFIQTITTALREEDWQRLNDSTSMDVHTDFRPSGSSTSVSPPESSTSGSSLDANDPSSRTQFHASFTAKTNIGQFTQPSSVCTINVSSKESFRARTEPSQVLNQYLLSRYPVEAKVAATASESWSHAQDDFMDNPDGLVAAVLEKYSPMVDADGVASFISMDDPDAAREVATRKGLETETLAHSLEQLDLIPQESILPYRNMASQRFSASSTEVFAEVEPLSPDEWLEEWTRIEAYLGAREANERSSIPVSPKKGLFQCKKCTKTFMRGYDLQRHLKAIHESTGIPCPLATCAVVCARYDIWKRHMREQHPDCL